MGEQLTEQGWETVKTRWRRRKERAAQRQENKKENKTECAKVLRAIEPEGWDEEDDGKWEPPLVPDPADPDYPMLSAVIAKKSKGPC